MNEILLEAKGLTKEFTLKNRKKVHAVSDVSLEHLDERLSGS